MRRGIVARVSPYELSPTMYTLELRPSDFPEVSVVIPTRDACALLRQCVDSVRRHTQYPNYQIVIVDNQSSDKELERFLQSEQQKGPVKIITYDKPFNHSDINNYAIEQIDSDFVVLMNNDVVIISDNWLEQLVATVYLSDSVAIAGGMLLYPNALVQHGGIILGLNSAAGHAHKNIHAKMPGYHGRLHALQEFSAITAALAIVRKSSFESVGGFDSENYPNLYNDVDLCIRLRKIGFRCLYNPMVKAIHSESATRTITKEDIVHRRRLQEEYAVELGSDPFYNPHLALDNEQFYGYRPFPIDMQVLGRGDRADCLVPV